MRAIDADGLLRELTALSHGQVWPGWTYEGIRLLIERQPPLTPPNEPLTLEELREMDGEPVWIAPAKSAGKIPSRWTLYSGMSKSLDCTDVYVFATASGIAQGYKANGYGNTWLAYRRPPEGEPPHD